MTIDLVVVGKTDTEAVEMLTSIYQRRINHYLKFSIITVPDVRAGKKGSASIQKKQEGEGILRQISEGDFVVLLDELGAEYDSMSFASWVQKRLNSGIKRLVFVIGGPYGFVDEVYKRADSTLSLSRMTFSHQTVRAIFTEQLYRAFTILGNEPYHHA